MHLGLNEYDATYLKGSPEQKWRINKRRQSNQKLSISNSLHLQSIKNKSKQYMQQLGERLRQTNLKYQKEKEKMIGQGAHHKSNLDFSI